MELKTAQIIMMCKQPQNFGDKFETKRDIVNCYMSHYSGTPIDFYETDWGKSMIDQIVFNALCDYLDSCEKPSITMKTIAEIKRIFPGEIDNTELILRGLAETQVQEFDKETGTYYFINGFTKDNTKVLKPEDFQDEC